MIGKLMASANASISQFFGKNRIPDELLFEQL
jgi:hypothetical protein